MSEPSFLGGRFPPHRIFAGWLGEAHSARLLVYALASEPRFTPTRLAHEGTGRLETLTRQSSVLTDLGAFARPLRRKALALQSVLEMEFEMARTPPNSTQLEVVAHGDGAFYRPHTDTFTGDQYTPGGRRRLTMVYYFHREPRRFTGGRLRLFDLGGGQTVDVEPTHDSLLVFPSTARHEVERVSCPEGAFGDGRFAVNIWLCG